MRISDWSSDVCSSDLRTRFSTEGQASHEGWEGWRGVFAPLFDIREENPPDRFRAEIDVFDLDTLIVAKIAFDGVQQTGFRSRELIRRSGLDHYAIELCLENDGYHCEGDNGDARSEEHTSELQSLMRI